MRCSSKPIIEKTFNEFLIDGYNPEEKEFVEDESQIKEIFVHGNYLSMEDIKIAQKYDIDTLSSETGFENIKSLAKALNDLYKEYE